MYSVSGYQKKPRLIELAARIDWPNIRISLVIFQIRIKTSLKSNGNNMNLYFQGSIIAQSRLKNRVHM